MISKNLMSAVNQALTCPPNLLVKRQLGPGKGVDSKHRWTKTDVVQSVFQFFALNRAAGGRLDMRLTAPFKKKLGRKVMP